MQALVCEWLAEPEKASGKDCTPMGNSLNYCSLLQRDEARIKVLAHMGEQYIMNHTQTCIHFWRNIQYSKMLVCSLYFRLYHLCQRPYFFTINLMVVTNFLKYLWREKQNMIWNGVFLNGWVSNLISIQLNMLLTRLGE